MHLDVLIAEPAYSAFRSSIYIADGSKMDDLIILISLIILELSDAHDKQILNSLVRQSRSGLRWIISPGTLYIQLSFLK